MHWTRLELLEFVVLYALALCANVYWLIVEGYIRRSLSRPRRLLLLAFCLLLLLGQGPVAYTWLLELWGG